MKTAVVTGASSGVGRVVAQQLVHNGYRVYAQYRSGVPQDADPRITWWHADFEQDFSVPTLDRVDALILCAGVASLSPVSEVSREEWNRHFTLNVIAPAEVTSALLPALRAAQGSVVYLNSGAGHHTRPQWGTYSASKFAARAWADALRQEEPTIRVTSIYPGRIATPMQEAIVAQEGKDYDPTAYLSPDTVAATVLAALEAPAEASIPDISIRPR